MAAPSALVDELPSGDVRRRMRRATEPLYISLAQLLRGEIAAGQWQAGAQLPTIDDFAARYGLARVTVRQALARLADEGLIERIQGKGTFVSAQAPARRRIELESSWQDLLQMLGGNVPEELAVEPVATAVPLQSNDGKPRGSYRYMRRLHRSQGTAYCVIDLYLANACYRRAPEAFDSRMVIPLIVELLGRRVKRMTQRFRILTADLVVARLLDLPVNAPIGEVRRVITDIDDRVLYLGIAQYRGDNVVFNTTIDLPTARPAG